MMKNATVRPAIPEPIPERSVAPTSVVFHYDLDHEYGYGCDHEYDYVEYDYVEDDYVEDDYVEDDYVEDED